MSFKVIEPLDALIISYENNGYNGNGCYIPKYHLSDYACFKNKTNQGDFYEDINTAIEEVNKYNDNNIN